MPIRCSVFIATSLDGFIARPNGDLDWLPGSDGSSHGEDYGYRAFFDSVDTLVMGRRTYELVTTFPDWPYNGKRVVVLSSRYTDDRRPISDLAEGTSAPPEKLVADLEQSGAQHIYVDGGRTIQGFLRAGLINEMTITRVPVLIGDGLPLFGLMANDVPLHHLSTRAFSSGLVQSRYALGLPPGRV